MEFDTTNGVKVEIKAASWKDACALRKAVEKAMKNTSVWKSFNSTNISLLDVDLSSLMQIIIDIDISDDFENAIMNCLRYCIYDKGGKNLKITAQLFDDIPEAREEYYEIVLKCLEENLRPFFKSLASTFSNELKAIPDENLKSE